MKCSTSQSLPGSRWANTREILWTQSNSMQGCLTHQLEWFDPGRSTWKLATYLDNRETDKEIIHLLRITSMKSLARYRIPLGDSQSLANLQHLNIYRWWTLSCRLIWQLLQYRRSKGLIDYRQMSFQDWLQHLKHGPMTEAQLLPLSYQGQHQLWLLLSTQADVHDNYMLLYTLYILES